MKWRFYRIAKFEILPGLTFVDRAGRGAKSTFSRMGHRVPRSKRTHVIIHHTVVSDNNDLSPILWETLPEVYSNMRRLQTIRPDLGNDVPYSFLVYLLAKKKCWCFVKVEEKIVLVPIQKGTTQ